MTWPPSKLPLKELSLKLLPLGRVAEYSECHKSAAMFVLKLRGLVLGTATSEPVKSSALASRQRSSDLFSNAWYAPLEPLRLVGTAFNYA
jgi:hypothetical protein